MLHDRAPQVDLASDTAPLIAQLAQVLTALRSVDAAGAVQVRLLVGVVPVSGPAYRRQRPTRRPSLAVERPQPGGIPPPDAVADDRRNEVGNFHGATGTRAGSGFGSGLDAGGSEVDSRAGSLTGSSRGSTTIVRRGSPTFIWSPYVAHVRKGRITVHLGVFRRGSPRVEFFADEAPAHALADDDEHLAYLVGACAGRPSLVFVGNRHVDSRGQPLAQVLHPNPRAVDGNSRWPSSGGRRSPVRCSAFSRPASATS